MAFLDNTGLAYLWGKIKAIIPTKTSDLTNDSGYLTSYTETDPTVPSWAKSASKPTYTASEVGAAEALHNHAAGDINSGTLDSARLPTSGVSAGSYGPSADASPAHGGTFSVPYVTFDNKGRATAASTKTITLPSSSSGLTATDLWTNASPGSSFSAQTISLSAATSGFKLILIVYRFDSSGGMWSTLIPYETLYSYGCTLHINASSYNRVGARAVSQSSYSQLTFASATYNTATANGYIIPYKVIGLK